MKNKILERLKIILKKVEGRFSALTWQRKAWIVCIAASFIAILLGPCMEFGSDRRAIEKESLLRAHAIVELLAAKNVQALTSANDLLYDLNAATSANGVKDAFIAGPTGIIVAPASRFREDARKYEAVSESLVRTDVSVKASSFGKYELCAPIMNGQNRLGVAFIEFSALNESTFSLVWQFIKKVFVLMAVFGMAAIAIIGAFKKQTERQETVSQPTFTDHEGATRAMHHSGLCTLSEHVGSQIFFLDGSFVITFANKQAVLKRGASVGRHIMDVGKPFMEMAEEMEMLQLAELKRGEATIWRTGIDDERYKYGLII